MHRLLLLFVVLHLTSLFPSLRAEERSGQQTVIHIGPIEIRENGKPNMIAVGHDLTVPAGETNHDVVTVMGNATINGRVEGDVVVVVGEVNLGPSAVVLQPMKVIGGDLNVESGAQHVGFKGPRFSVPAWLRVGLQDWFRQCVFLARPMTHQPGFSWWMGGISLLVFLLVFLFMPRSVQACVRSVEARPASSFLVGLLTITLTGPLLFLLVASVVGLVVVPFIVCAGVMGCLLGKISVYLFAGQRFGEQLKVGFLQNPLVALATGTILFFLVYMVPLLGFLAWGLTATMAIGAVVMAGAKSFRSEMPRRPESLDASLLVPVQLASAEQTPGEETVTADMARAGFWIRLLAVLLDLVLVGAITLLLTVADLKFGPVFMVLWVGYHLWMWTWRGTTIGGIVAGLKVVRLTGQPVSFNIALVRCLSAFFSFLVLCLGFFWAGWTRERQSWHDMIAGTVIVRFPRRAIQARSESCSASDSGSKGEEADVTI